MLIKGVFVTNEGVWKAIVCSLTIWLSGGICEITSTPLTLHFCAIATAEDVCPSSVGLHNAFVGAVAVIELPCCDVSPVTGVRIGAIIGSNA
ncbi:unnamed protein product [Lactuca saligna]|uniref:Uncharacterized protein n=1 Tax=Lactuca saligna TaxID=75948 RepID=A0AA36EBS4_LACSI|nr:unnamed protein product [Lactuca saligna]